MYVYWEVWNLLLKIDNREQFWDNIEIIKHEIYEAYKFCAAGS